MKIELEIKHSHNDTARIDLTIDNGLSAFKGFDLIPHDEIETLELQLTEIVQKLYNYRRKHDVETDKMPACGA